jgi:hypothetical protein
MERIGFLIPSPAGEMSECSAVIDVPTNLPRMTGTAKQVTVLTQKLDANVTFVAFAQSVQGA